MSRVGKLTINIPDKVKLSVANGVCTVVGPRGTLEKEISPKLSLEITKDTVAVLPHKDATDFSAIWGTTRALLANMVKGVSVGFVRELEFTGVGYKATVEGSLLTLSLGFSHTIPYSLPKGIQAKVQKNIIELSGHDNELLGLVAAQVRSYRPPEPYKGKGVRYIDEKIIRKAGKAGGKKG